ncbi:malate dehydrogenase [Candidatus Uhrbacteria bacterium RIFCSPHIGHO2_02_FULL_60_10]|uniref:Malate dehydrogenase n=1 Tax=Candidatus Uhrbacteria bacterium RIFCSPHIGHO2_02_FULL_60_10 TaxID=1802392 RepID=A0A1F7U6L0_9BACT|nr:MAG: malate dehydrogenase [Candidatus Uhrbacteria bacterium RIFCSPHIGHO2_02_FULL_60_10]
MPDIFSESLDLHRRLRGKLETRGKIALSGRQELSLIYTPGVAAVSSAIGRDRSLARTLSIKGNSVAVVSDGSAILGLGDLGPEAAIPVMEGKAVLLKEFAGIDAFPICLSCRGVDEIVAAVKAIAPVFGGINLEDIAAPRCFEIERRLRAELDIPVMHDDQHGTATVVLAALINALKVKGLSVGEARLVVNGAGAAGTAVTKLLRRYGFGDITVCDSRGVIGPDRNELNPAKMELAALTNPRRLTGTLAAALRDADIFIGVSAAGVLNQEMIRMMRPQPIVLALANPTPEIMPDEARAAGALVVGTGRSDYPNQINNVLAFPGIFRGALDNGVRLIEPAMLTAAAERLAACVPAPTPEMILPDVFDRSVMPAVAAAFRPSEEEQSPSAIAVPAVSRSR